MIFDLRKFYSLIDAKYMYINTRAEIRQFYLMNNIQ